MITPLPHNLKMNLRFYTMFAHTQAFSFEEKGDRDSGGLGVGHAVSVTLTQHYVMTEPNKSNPIKK